MTLRNATLAMKNVKRLDQSFPSYSYAREYAEDEIISGVCGRVVNSAQISPMICRCIDE